jgi:hypothetical protein
VIKPVKEEFPHSGFPVKVVHKDGKDLKDSKTCYFQCEAHAKKYIERSKFKKKDYKILVRGETE